LANAFKDVYNLPPELRPQGQAALRNTLNNFNTRCRALQQPEFQGVEEFERIGHSNERRFKSVLEVSAARRRVRAAKPQPHDLAQLQDVQSLQHLGCSDLTRVTLTNGSSPKPLIVAPRIFSGRAWRHNC